MKYSETKQGRVFVIRLENGEILHESIEKFAIERSVKAASLIVVGGADDSSKLIVGPEDGRSKKVVPVVCSLDGVHEVTGTGTLFPDEEGIPHLHMHLSCGRGNDVITGCIRHGVKVWHIMEVILTELIDCSAVRKSSPMFPPNLKLLEP